VSAVQQIRAFSKLPSTDELLRHPDMQALIECEGHAAVAESIRVVLARLRQEIAESQADGSGDEKSLDEKSLAGPQRPVRAVERQLRQSLSYSLRPLINATGVILHTNLGRAPLAAAALDHIRATAGVYSNLEFDLLTGERGKRDVHVDRLFRKLLAITWGRTHSPDFAQDWAEHSEAAMSASDSAAISTIVVNNNAAAVLLALNSLAEGGEVIVSRGELVEIGGSFRIPDVMSKSNATLREVGTTNRTRVADYERAINERTRLLLRVHRSNFEITGFTEQPGLDELVALARRRNLPLMEDLGSGALV
jgi:L-seryl-tRNA(Ser) seleniumtransferase